MLLALTIPYLREGDMCPCELQQSLMQGITFLTVGLVAPGLPPCFLRFRPYPEMHGISLTLNSNPNLHMLPLPSVIYIYMVLLKRPKCPKIKSANYQRQNTETLLE